MKRKWIALIVLIILFLFAVCLLAVLLIHKKNNDESVSYTKEKVCLENIKSDETVLVIRYENYADDHFDKMLIINKNKQLKLINLLKRNETPNDLLHFCDEKLQSKDIPLKKEQLTISNEMLSEIINISDYKLKSIKPYGADQGKYSIYSVCGSGCKREMVLLGRKGDNKLQSNSKKINALCDNIYNLFHTLDWKYRFD